MNRKMILGAGAALLTVLCGCVRRPAPFDPDDARMGVRVSLPAGAFDVYESDSIPLFVDPAATGAAGSVQALLLDANRTVLWRSEAIPFRGRGPVRLPVTGVPPIVVRGAQLQLTAVATDGSGQRYYATDDTSAVAQLADAATRSGRVWAGRRLVAGDGGTPGDVVLAPELGRAYFPIPSASSVGVVDLAGDGRFVGTVAAGVRPEFLDYRGGRLVALGAGGGELSVLDASAQGLSAARSQLLPALEIELDTTFLGAVRPSGRAVAVGCDGEACQRVFAVVPSGLQTISGSLFHTTSDLSVLRIVDVDSKPGGPTLVLPSYTDAVADDTSAAIAVFAASPPQGGRELQQRASNASACLSTALGSGPVAAGRDGVLYVVSPGMGGPCGAGTAIVRIEGAGSVDAVVSVLGIRNIRAEDRIGEIAALRLAADGSALLAMSAGSVSVLDPALRVRGTLTVPGVRNIAWGGSERFAVATAEGVSIYDAVKLTRIRSIAIGPTSGALLYVRRDADGDLILAGIPGGFVVTRVPE